MINTLAYKWLSSLGTNVFKTLEEVMIYGIEKGYSPEELSDIVIKDEEDFFYSSITYKNEQIPVFGTSRKHILHNIKELEKNLNLTLSDDDIKIALIQSKQKTLPVFYIEDNY